jgi:DNA (cytosine-5)-methyltransferase 1
MSQVYYNEIDPFAAAWLRELIKEKMIAEGDVDERSIEDIRPIELRKYTQCHFFAGIGVWSYALRLSGWPDDRPVWTGSCPCQPFSAAGQRKGFADERHLWPSWFHLIGQCKPDAIFGEQVKAAIGQGWLDLVQNDLEGIGYAFGAVPFPACSVGAPHIRQRVYFVADSERHWGHDRRRLYRRCFEESEGRKAAIGSKSWLQIERNSSADGLANPGEQRRQQISGSAFGNETENGLARWNECEPNDNHLSSGNSKIIGVAYNSESGLERTTRTTRTSLQEPSRGFAFNAIEGKLGDSDPTGPQGWQLSGPIRERNSESELTSRSSGPDDRRDMGNTQELGYQGESVRTDRESSFGTEETSFWSNCDWLPCQDGKYRPVEPGTFPLAHGSPARVGRLRGYGNAINAEQAKAFIQAYLEITK